MDEREGEKERSKEGKDEKRMRGLMCRRCRGSRGFMGGCGGGAYGFWGVGPSPSCRLFWKLPAATLPAIRIKPVLTGGRWKVTVNFCQARLRCLFISRAEWEDVHYSGCENVPALIIFNLIIHPGSFFPSCDQIRGGKADTAGRRHCFQCRRKPLHPSFSLNSVHART